jgi:hypothetical protein
VAELHRMKELKAEDGKIKRMYAPSHQWSSHEK